MSDKAARLAYNKAYYRKNRERLLAEQKARDQQRDLAEPGARDQYQQEYRAANKEALLEKQRARNRANYAANKPGYRARGKKARLKKYGITAAQKKAILDMQEHQCPICERFLTESHVPSIDHCHVSGSVRGILCRRCNAALGMLDESPANLERALEYLSMRKAQEMTRLLSGATSTTSSGP
ncbi:endonuclease VII domain-containing protein [Acidovorax sp. A1169]|uniref:endonuclease VII domain-containing protein n=1 Tax=Acidovorax sp. A1169 TaxID=3059524 RepID=UPI0035228034